MSSNLSIMLSKDTVEKISEYALHIKMSFKI